MLVVITLLIHNVNFFSKEKKEKYRIYNFNDLESIESYNVDRLKELNGGVNPTIYYNENGLVKGIYGKYTYMTINNGKDAIRSLYNIKDLFGMNNPAKEFIVDKEMRQENQVIYRLQQVYNGYLVYSNQIIITVNENGESTSISGKYTPVSNISFDNKVDKEEAIKIAKQYSYDGRGSKYKSEKVVYIQNDDSARVAWMIRYNNINNITKDKIMFIDAEDRKLLSEIPLIIN